MIIKLNKQFYGEKEVRDALETYKTVCEGQIREDEKHFFIDFD